MDTKNLVENYLSSTEDEDPPPSVGVVSLDENSVGIATYLTCKCKKHGEVFRTLLQHSTLSKNDRDSITYLTNVLLVLSVQLFGGGGS